MKFRADRFPGTTHWEYLREIPWLGVVQDGTGTDDQKPDIE
ncbi:MAG: hypothetical protein R2813_12155 [Flavobacteriales bacterium]